MKKTFDILKRGAAALMLLGAVLASCSKEPAVSEGDTAPLIITSATVGELTKAADPATGYDGVVKKEFVAGDVITIDIRTSEHGSNLFYTAYEYDGSGWPPIDGHPELYLPVDGNFYFSAYYSPNGEIADFPAVSTIGDDLECVAAPGDGSGILSFDGTEWTATLKFRHAQSLLRFSVVDGTKFDKPTLSGIVSVTADIASNPETRFGVEAWNDGDASKNAAIAPGGCIISKITVTLASGQVLTADINPNKTVEANKAYDVVFTAYENTVEASVSPAEDWGWTGGGDLGYVVPPGYDMVVYDEASLREFARRVNENSEFTLKVIQTADITLTDPDGDPSNGNWTPVGNNTVGLFAGAYNGNGFEIRNLKVKGSYDGGGLFGYISGAVLVGINLPGVEVEGVYYAGALAGQTMNSTIALCTSSGTVRGRRVGGMVGEASKNTHITRSRSACEITNNVYAGGFVGTVESNSVIAGCSATGKIAAADMYPDSVSYAGGFAGKNSGRITFCYATDDITGRTIAGGFAGWNTASIEYCYATGAISGSNPALTGSFAGENSSSGSFEDCHAFVTATGGSNDNAVGYGSSTGISTAAGGAAVTVARPGISIGFFRTVKWSAATGYGITPVSKMFNSLEANGDCIWALPGGGLTSDPPVLNYGYNGFDL